MRYQRNSCRRRIESTRGVFEKDTSSTSIQSSPCRCDPLSITTSTGFASTRYPTFVWHIDFLPPPFDNYFQQPRIYHSHFDRPCHNQTIPFQAALPTQASVLPSAQSRIKALPIASPSLYLRLFDLSLKFFRQRFLGIQHFRHLLARRLIAGHPV